MTVNTTMSTMGRLVDVTEFADLIVKNDAEGRVVRLGEVAEIELGAQGYDQTCTFDGKPSVAVDRARHSRRYRR